MTQQKAFWDKIATIEQSGERSAALDIPLSLVEPDDVGLRSKVNKDDPTYKSLVDSIKANGVLNAISVRRVGDKFVIIDGLHRFTASEDAGQMFISANYFPSVKPDDVMWLQIVGNKHKVETKPAQYGQQLQKIFSLDPTLTIAQMADRLNISPSWVSERLKLAANLIDAAKVLVDQGKIPVSTASSLANLEPDTQEDWLDRCQSIPPTEIIPQLHQAVQRERKAKRESNKGNDKSEFVPIAKLRSKTDVSDIMYSTQKSLQNKGLSDQDVEDARQTTEYEIGYGEALAWVLSLDEETVLEAKSKALAEEAARQEKRADKERLRLLEKSATEGLAKTITGKQVHIKGMDPVQDLEKAGVE